MSMPSQNRWNDIYKAAGVDVGELKREIDMA